MFIPPPPAGESAQANPPEFDVHGYVLECLEKGSTPEQVRKQLIARGHARPEADEIVRSVVQWRTSHYAQQGIDLDDPATIRAAGMRNVLIGGGICLVGLLVTVVTFSAASESGGRYVIAGGAIF